MEISTISECLLFSTVRIMTFKTLDRNAKDAYVGTGFVFEYETDGRTALFLITSKHVIKDMQRGLLTFTQARNGNPIIGKEYTLSLDDFERLWFVHPDDDIDVAVMPFSILLKFVEDEGIELFLCEINSSLLLSDDALKTLHAIEEVIFIGHSGGVWDDINLIPITRKGITATPLSIDFQGKKEFLIDASVFPGSSGSPVFLSKFGAYPDKSGVVKWGTRFNFLGILTEAYHGREIDEEGLRTQPIADKSEKPSSEWVNLGVVLKPYMIIETINAFLKENGIGID
jgi:hypothetical protein